MNLCGKAESLFKFFVGITVLLNVSFTINFHLLLSSFYNGNAAIKTGNATAQLKQLSTQLSSRG
jgi:hypothetical protein